MRAYAVEHTGTGVRVFFEKESKLYCHKLFVSLADSNSEYSIRLTVLFLVRRGNLEIDQPSRYDCIKNTVVGEVVDHF